MNNLMNKKVVFIIFALLLSCGCTSTLYFTLDDGYVNDKYKLEDVVEERNLINDSNEIHCIAKIIGDINKEGKLKDQYGNWFRYYHLPCNSNYKGFIRVDDESAEEYLIGYDQYNNEDIILVARDYGDGADFETVFSIYHNDTIFSTKISGHYLIDELMDTILFNVLPDCDTIYGKKLFHLNKIKTHY